MTLPPMIYGAGVTMSVVAQTTPDNAGVSWAAIVAQLGFATVFLYGYQQERKERIRVQDQASEIARLAYPLLATVGKVLENVERGMSSTANRVMTAPEETEHGLAHALDAIAIELKAQREDRGRAT